MAVQPGGRFDGVRGATVLTLAFGTTLNPLNSSMIAVALPRLRDDFGVSVTTVTWLVTGFYVAAAVGQPLMGRLVDQFGARRLFLLGLSLVLVSSALMPLAPGIWWLVGLRVVQALGTSTAYPSALVLIRAATPDGRSPTAALGAITMANSTCAALGPVLGGFLVAIAGWPAVFIVNLPLTAVGLVLGWRFLPRISGQPSAGRRTLLTRLDLPGVALFAATLVALLLFVLSFAARPWWWLLPVIAGAAVALVGRERSVASPFLDVRGLVANRALSSVLIQQGVINLVFYCTFFAFPLWLQAVRHYPSDVAGLLVLPIAALGVLTVPVAGRLIRRRGARASLLLGSVVLLGATGMIQLLGDDTAVLAIIVFTVLLGVPNGFNNLGLQTALYEATPDGRTGSSGGLFQTFRYLGAISATAAIGVVFERNLSSAGLHHLGWLMTGGAVVVLALAVLVRRPGRLV